MTAEQRDAMKLAFQITVPEAAEVFKGARIPTSDVSLPSVFVSLAADHIGGEKFHEYLQGVCALQPALPLPRIDKFAESLGVQLNNIRGSHWFMHNLPNMVQ